MKKKYALPSLIVNGSWKYKMNWFFAGIIQYFNNKGETVKVESFSDAFYKPDGLYESGMLDHIFRGMIKSHTQVRILIIKYLVGCSDLTFELK